MISESKTKSERAYRILRRAIITGEMEAEQPLDEADLVERHHLGRTPLREALKRLALEQFVVWPAHRTPYVRGVGVVDLQRLSESRLVLEEPVARLSAERISDPELAELTEISRQLQKASERGEVYEAVELDHELHLAIARGTHNRFLADAVKNLNCGSLRLWFLTDQQLGVAGVYERHEAILQAIRRHDPHAAAAEMRQHVLHSHERQMQLHALLPLDGATPSLSIR